jgi:LacI family transcriptional regulator
MAKVSLNNIARRLNVSPTLVSLVLNGQGEKNRISPEVRKKVLELAGELNYKPNSIAKSLRTGYTQTIGVILSDISNPLFAKLARLIEDEAYEKGYTVFFVSSDEDSNRTSGLINSLRNKQVDGLIIVPTENNMKDLLELKKHNIPFVIIDRHLPKIKANYVGIDNFKGGYEATSHLLQSGFREIGFISYNWKLINYKNRYDGYRAAIKQFGIRIKSDWVKFVSYSSGENGILDALSGMFNSSQPPQALFLANNTIGGHALKILKQWQIAIPQDLALISFDNDPVFSLTEPPLSVVDQPFEQMASYALQLLSRQIADPSAINYDEKYVFDPSLIIRQSSLREYSKPKKL